MKTAIIINTCLLFLGIVIVRELWVEDQSVVASFYLLQEQLVIKEEIKGSLNRITKLQKDINAPIKAMLEQKQIDVEIFVLWILMVREVRELRISLNKSGDDKIAESKWLPIWLSQSKMLQYRSNMDIVLSHFKARDGLRNVLDISLKALESDIYTKQGAMI